MSCDVLGNPLNFSLTGGQVHDVTAAPELIEQAETLGEFLIADKGYDSDEFRALQAQTRVWHWKQDCIAKE